MSMTEQEAAVELVRLLFRRHKLDNFLNLTRVSVRENYKIKFKFEPFVKKLPKQTRFGRRPGLEMEWKTGVGDVDAWSPLGGDLLALLGHGVQVARETVGFNAEKPSKLLRIALKDEA